MFHCVKLVRLTVNCEEITKCPRRSEHLPYRGHHMAAYLRQSRVHLVGRTSPRQETFNIKPQEKTRLARGWGPGDPGDFLFMSTA